MRRAISQQMSFGDGFIDPRLYQLDEELTKVDELLSQGPRSTKLTPIVAVGDLLRSDSSVWEYARYRPRYPQNMLNLLQQETGLESSWVVADVGSGTGASAELFLDAGHVVYGIEPIAPVREAAKTLLGLRYPGFQSIAGSAEFTTLPKHSIDLVVCAQSFHSFEPTAVRAEFCRVLRAPPWAVLIWNERRKNVTSFMCDYERLLLHEFGEDSAQSLFRNVTSCESLARFFGSSDYGATRLLNCQTLDLDGLTGQLASTSYSPECGDGRKSVSPAAARELFEKHQTDGRVQIDYDTIVYWGQLPAGG